MAKIITKKELRLQRDAMARFLIGVCKNSDAQYGYGRERSPGTEKHYRTARRLIKRAGFKYEGRP